MVVQVSSQQDARLLGLQTWARHALTHATGVDPGPVLAVPLGGDASFRRYFRAALGQASVMLVDAPPERENTPAFLAAAQEFATAGLHTPRVMAADIEQGYMIQEDLGDQLYLPCLLQAQAAADERRSEQLYQQAMSALLLLQADKSPSQLPYYSRQLLEQEMCLFDHWFCAEMLGMTLSSDEREMLTATRELLITSALAQPQVRVHRDYHSRNLMVCRQPDGSHPEDRPPGIIDFQDAVIGAVTYDLVSLLRDCYICWPAEQVCGWVTDYAARARQLGILSADYSDHQFIRDFDLMGLQRHIKVLGIFCRLTLRDGKSRYLADLPLVMQYVENVAAQHPEMALFHRWFATGPAPAMREKLRNIGVVAG